MMNSQLNTKHNNSAVVPPQFSLPPHLFAEIFPFHLVFNRSTEVLQVGEVLQRICPKLSVGSQLNQHFQIIRPHIGIEFDTIQAQSKSLRTYARDI